MAYTITITTPEEYVNDSDYMQMIIIFDVNLDGVNESYDALSKGIRVPDWGESELNYDLEDSLLVPGIYRCSLSDSEGYLENLFFGTSEPYLSVSKNPLVQIKLNGLTEYKGYIQEDTLLYDKSRLTVSFTLDPTTSILNKTQLFKTENGLTRALDPLGLLGPGVEDYSIKEAILKCYQIANPNVTLDTSHDWLFWGIKEASLYPYTFLENIKFDEIATNLNFLYRPVDNVKNVAGILRKLAIDFCAVTGMLDYERAFFKKLFFYDPDNVQSMEMKRSHSIKYWYQLVDFVKIKLEIENVVNKEYLWPPDGENVFLEQSKIERELFCGFHSELEGVYTVGATHTNMYANIARGSDNDGKYFLIGVKDPLISNIPDYLNSGFLNFGNLISKYWYYYRNKMAKMRVDVFTFSGVNYSFLKNFQDNGNKYQIIKMVKKYSSNTTEIEALHLGAV